ncbi:hypothetical protein [Candidatus Marimicrobium litorale]|uniref:Uncharacterized protein n=1 Tax=Candidatus Marimicrobium litorale TaxID=2518991 RepID=A0ABT3T8S9_9GAMM|nr:hypothetical protein [Candidatus Marimicrobium litorale]MCX2978454.1 hypothetical protein [Candidatus Marimicrobium litorale]
MSANKLLLLVYMVLMAPIVIAESAYELHGLSSRMTFSAALEQAKALGGACEVQTVRKGESIQARCDYLVCRGSGEGEGCPDGQDSTAPDLFGEPVSSIWMDAEDDNAMVKRIALVIDGDINAVEQHFREKHGKPFNDTSLLEHSWTNEVRIHWASGSDNLGLQRLRSSITLFTNPEPADIGSGSP